MGLPATPVTLTPEQLAELNQKLATFRHDVNNHLMLIMASAEIIQLHPENSATFLKNIVDQPQKISEAMKKFSGEFERTFGINRP